MTPEMQEFFGRLWSIVRRIGILYISYPDGRVKRLALYAKKRRTRKKNMRRIARELQRRLKANEH